MTITWKEPPPNAPRTRRSPVKEAFEELKAHPNTWGIVREYKSRNAAKVAVSSTWRRRAKDLDETFEFTADDEGKVYGRYVAETEEVAPE